MRNDTLLLQDILDAVQVIKQYLPVDRADFDGNPPVQSHILRHLQIIGEAAWRLSDPLKTANADVPWRQIAGMRHVLVHDYFRVDWDIVFTTARDHIHPLEAAVAKMVASLPAP